jgi:histone acetyltransferase (RNA polymerase elongator complex component)
MWGKGFPQDNPESWRDIRSFIAEYPDTKDWIEWKRIARDIVESLASDGLDVSFRIGQSMSHIIFSTLEHHRLEREPRVTLEIRSAEKKVKIAYSDANLWFNATTDEKVVAASDAPFEVKKMLRRLWTTTRPIQELPDALKTA